MKPVRQSILLALTLLWCLPSPLVWGQVPAAAPTPTLWSFLGISQGAARLRDGVLNRRGNFPGLEKKPPVKRIADPENLVSDDPAIKRAAEIKKQEDLKKQKIKAIKYLAKIGCGCYDQDGSVTAALIEKMKDCTEGVRLTAAEQIKAAAEGGCCAKCGSRSCCNEKIVAQLAIMAYERDDKGCYIEPSEDVRAAAKEALKTCCPRELSDMELQMEQLPNPEPEREKAPEDAEERETAPEEEPLPPQEENGTAADEMALQQPIAERLPVAIEDASIVANEDANTVAPEVEESVTEATEAAVPQPLEDVEPTTEEPSIGSPVGTMAGIDVKRGIAHVHISQPAPIPAGSVLHVFRLEGEEVQLVGTMSVYEAFSGSANVRATGTTDFSQLKPGSPVWLVPQAKSVAPVVTRISHTQTLIR